MSARLVDRKIVACSQFRLNNALTPVKCIGDPWLNSAQGIIAHPLVARHCESLALIERLKHSVHCSATCMSVWLWRLWLCALCWYRGIRRLHRHRAMKSRRGVNQLHFLLGIAASPREFLGLMSPDWMGLWLKIRIVDKQSAVPSYRAW